MKKNYNILVIDDDPCVIDSFRLIFEDMENCSFYPALSFVQAKVVVEEIVINLAIIDIVLPEIDGYELCKLFNQHPNSCDAYFILMSVDKKGLYDRIKAFKVGAQDFISKPFDLFEVELMIKSKIDYWLKTKKHQLEATTKSMISSGKFSIDNDQKKITIGGEEIELATLEYKILIFFIANSLKQIEYNEILVNVWGDINKTSAESVRKLIYKLRIKIEKDPQNPIYLVKAKTSGYIFYPDGKPVTLNK